jgi:hypothetical protein
MSRANATCIRKIVNHSSSAISIRSGDKDMNVDGFDTLDDVSIAIPAAATPIAFRSDHAELIFDGDSSRPTKLWIGGPGDLVRISDLPNYNALSVPVDGNFRSGGERILTIDNPIRDRGPHRILLSSLNERDTFDTPTDCWMSFIAGDIGSRELRKLHIPGARIGQGASVRELFLRGVRFFEFELALNDRNVLVFADGTQQFGDAARTLALLSETYPGEIFLISLNVTPNVIAPPQRDLGEEIVQALGVRVYRPSKAPNGPQCIKVWNAGKGIIIIDRTLGQCFRNAAIHPGSLLRDSTAQQIGAPPAAGLWCIYDAVLSNESPAARWISYELQSKGSPTNIVVFESSVLSETNAKHLALLATAQNIGLSVAAPSQPPPSPRAFFIDDVLRKGALRELRGTFDPVLTGFQSVHETPDGKESDSEVRGGSRTGATLVRLDEREKITNVRIGCSNRSVGYLALETSLSRRIDFGKMTGTADETAHAAVRGFCGLAGDNHVDALWPIVRT